MVLLNVVKQLTICMSLAQVPAQSNVTFSVNMSNYPGGLGADDTVYLNGSFAWMVW